MPLDDLKCTNENCDGKLKDFDRPFCFDKDSFPPCPKCGAKLEVDWMAKRACFDLKGSGYFKSGWKG